MQMRETEQDLMASRVIQKFNNNSERILNLLNKQKKPASSKDFLFDSMDRKDRQMQEAKADSNLNVNELIENPDQLYKRQKIGGLKEQDSNPKANLTAPE